MIDRNEYRGLFLKGKDYYRFFLRKFPRPRVSALVSVYHAADWIEACLNDLISQTLFKRGEMEIVIVDAASPNGEREMIQGFLEKFPGKIRYSRTRKRVSLYAAWNRGIFLSNGLYLTSANVDDKHSPVALEKMADYLDSHSETSLVYADQWITENPSDTFENHSSTRKWGWPAFDPEILERRCIIGPQPMWRRGLHYDFGYFDPKFRSAGDWEFWLRICRRVTISKMEEVLGLYFLNPEGLEASNPAAIQELAIIRSRYGLDDVEAEATIPVVVESGPRE